MPVILKILLFNSQPYTEGAETIINEQGGTIGRAVTNALVLPDEKKMISRCHASVKFENGQYLLIDSSLAGTFVDDATIPINNASVQLVDGMQLRIGDYTIACSIRDESSALPPAVPVTPFVDDFPFQHESNGLLDIPENNSPASFLPDEYGQSEPQELLSAAAINTDSGLFSASEGHLLDAVAEPENPPDKGLISENISSLHDSFTPSEPAAISTEEVPDMSQEEMPDDFNFEDFFQLQEGAVKAPVAQQVPIEEPVVSKPDDSALPRVSASESVITTDTQNQPPVIQGDQLLQAFLRGAQIENKGIDLSDPVEKMTRIGTMFRQFVDSTISVLRSRAEFKSMFRVSVTTIKKSDNNPLKFAVTTDEGLKHLINDGQGGFKKSVESIDEGFNDLLNHQLAMQAGIQASLTDVLRRFDPETIEKQYNEGLVLQKKSKCWEKYTQVHASLSETAVDDFFGDAFSEAYEQQMKQLKD
ncbi:MAG: type VI secretion system-associated FHA domain protein TagH [Methyloprofundus sp.]|nr:type VI secretion system-associated FHA domain protein TagH [Methyloprofundus sp.]